MTVDTAETVHTTREEILDPIAVEVHRRALDNISSEMGITLVRTSGSPVVSDTKDFSTCILDNDGEQLSLTGFVLGHAASSLLGVKTLVEDLREEGRSAKPGDGWIINDPHHGGALHQADVGIVMPTFHAGRQIGWAFANVHVLDIGGTSVSGVNPAARSVYEEGLRFPPLRVISEGRLDKEWEKFIAANVRVPERVLNDLRGMIAANNVAQQKLDVLVGQVGPERHADLCHESQRLTERLLRRRIGLLPDGKYWSTDWTEFDGHGEDLLLKIACEMEVAGGELRFTFSGAPQVDAYVNGGRGAVMGGAITALVLMLGYGDMPFNAGIWRPLNFDLGPAGTIINPRSPAPVSSAHAETGFRVIRAVRDVLSQAMALSDDEEIRGRCAGQAQDGACSVGVSGLNQFGKHSVVYYLDSAVGVGAGGQTVDDGQDCYGSSMMGGCGISDVETHEAQDPIAFLWRRILPNSGGPGTHRGGQGLDQAYLIDSSDRLQGFATVRCAEVPPRGFGGGMAGAASKIEHVVNSNAHSLMESGLQPLEVALDGDRPSMRNKEAPFTVRRGDVVRFLGGGGGGLGDPLLRDVGSVVKDVLDGYVLAVHAEKVYGVILDPGGTLNEEATASARHAALISRLGRTPGRPLHMPETPGVAVTFGADRKNWVCGSCGAELGAVSTNWRDATVMRERLASDVLDDLVMVIRARRSSPPLVLREHFCGSCACCLTVDVALEGDPLRPSPQLAPA